MPVTSAAAQYPWLWTFWNFVPQFPPLSGLLRNNIEFITIYYGELAHSKDGLKAQKVHSPEQRSGYG
ncbi:hypothetical protein [Hoylesella timonensis]|uniref:hypothetical protein n=1 Tax=Hoylesella timonensis TaxID=386414 RepID=UPI00242F81B9|nr:hypothetical protein [Hoylesella timonensis]